MAVKEAKPNSVILHTSAPGSPFCVLIPKKESDIKEAAVFCASFSKGWKEKKKQIEVQVFSKENVYKDKSMKQGTFGVLGKIKKIKVKPKLFLTIQEGKLHQKDIILKKQKFLEREWK